MSIKLNDILNFSQEELKNTKIKFNLMFSGNWNPIEIFKNSDMKTLLEGQYWNYSKQKIFKEGQTTIGFIRIKDDLWLLFYIGKVTRDLNVFNGVGYEHEELSEYRKYFGRLIVKYKNTSQNLARHAIPLIDECEVYEILPDIFDNDIFPGYDSVNLSWSDLSRVLAKDSWKTALQNQKGVYLITDTSNGKMYVGSAYGERMLLGRWEDYAKTGNGGNKELKELSFDHIKQYFRYSILDIFKSTIKDELIISRETWWKEVLLTRNFGYNKN
ncbi:GIY-YIG nuclease family protein [Capnocytophaga sp. G2]|uniref:GIY-YIG nuclease family protein n=1 Tax=Capnocytophaga sp. G2 TaxID=3110695 RepID=UPI002B4954C1|nr:GIY-YIG nuclease family protein [Capnocytophaga sp. G2]MEB3005829.1 GIY-YIG nuclease family protein [Capnocytophaga sp. G2]